MSEWVIKVIVSRRNIKSYKVFKKIKYQINFQIKTVVKLPKFFTYLYFRI